MVQAVETQKRRQAKRIRDINAAVDGASAPKAKAKVKAKVKPKQMSGTGGLTPAQVKARNNRISSTLAAAQAKQKRLREAEYSK